MPSALEVIEIAAGDVADELRRRGIASDQRVTLMIAPGQEWIPGRHESRARVVVAGLTDGDIDRLIKQAQCEVDPLIGWGSVQWIRRRFLTAKHAKNANRIGPQRPFTTRLISRRGLPKFSRRHRCKPVALR